jgi:Carbohydrate binding module (family 35)
MTAGNNDDPFAYLYRPEGGGDDADGDAAQGRTAAQPGVPRTSYNQVQRVGERRQAPQQQTGGYGYPPQQPQYGQQQYGGQPGYGPQPTQAMPQQGGGYDAPGGQGGQGGHGGRGGPQGRGPNNKGLLIGAVAVVAAVAIGIGVAMANGDSGSGSASGGGSSPSASATAGGKPGQSASASPSANAATGPGVTDAAALQLGGGAQADTQYTGAKAAGGKYVGNMTQVGASVTWKVDAPKAGTYDLWIRYANAEKDPAGATVVVNGKPMSYKPSLKNYGKEGDWNAWYRSYVSVQLDKGNNTVAVTCGQGDACHFNLDQLALMNEGDKPPGW